MQHPCICSQSTVRNQIWRGFLAYICLCAIGLSYTYTGSFVIFLWKFQTDPRPAYLDLDVEALRVNFTLLKNATKPYSGKLGGDKFDKMMKSYMPIVDTTQWSAHSPSGKNTFTIKQIQIMALSSRLDYMVPNIAHIVLPFGDNEIQFHHMVSILSCIHVMKPHRLLFWYAPGKLPKGQWWDRVVSNLSKSEWEERIVMVQRPIPSTVYTVPVNVKEHAADVMRMEAVLVFGGVYLDTDVFVLKPLEPLRKFPFTIGREIENGLCNGVFMSQPNGTFLAMWHTAYQIFNDDSWGGHSVYLPHTLHKVFPHLCHVEEESMDQPNWLASGLNLIYGKGQQSQWDWRTKNYVMHLWFRLYGKQHNMESIRTLDSMYGQMCRFILFGTL